MSSTIWGRSGTPAAAISRYDTPKNRPRAVGLADGFSSASRCRGTTRQTLPRSAGRLWNRAGNGRRMPVSPGHPAGSARACNGFRVCTRSSRPPRSRPWSPYPTSRRGRLRFRRKTGSAARRPPKRPSGTAPAAAGTPSAFGHRRQVTRASRTPGEHRRVLPARERPYPVGDSSPSGRRAPLQRGLMRNPLFFSHLPSRFPPVRSRSSGKQGPGKPAEAGGSWPKSSHVSLPLRMAASLRVS